MSYRFWPEEILFAPTGECNLRCRHCEGIKSRSFLSKSVAKKFLLGCRSIGIEKVGFTGGEPFKAVDFLCALVGAVVKEGMYFDRIMTNAVWHRSEEDLKGSLNRLRGAGYDGSICVSVDAFHNQELKKVASLIESAASIWRQKDIISIAYTDFKNNEATREKLTTLSMLLGGRLVRFGRNNSTIESHSLFIKIFEIDLSAIGKAHKLKNPWDGKWFKEDHCSGPGNVFFVMPDGNVAPCCGYANHLATLHIGNIKCDSVKDLMANSQRNRFVSAVFNSGLTKIRKSLEECGFKFPGKTSNHCYFCYYLLTKVPKNLLNKCLQGGAP